MHATDQALRKAAILVSSLDAATADRLLEQMPAEQAARVRRVMVELDEIDPDEQRDVIQEFVQPRAVDVEQGVELEGTLARRLAEGAAALPERMPPIPAATPTFRFLRETESERLSSMLQRERPQTIALVISHLPPHRAAGVLAGLGPALQAEVVRRLVDLDEADPEILRDIERSLHSRILEHIQTERRRAAGLAAVAGILEAADFSLKQEILSNLDRHDDALADKLRTGRLTFSALVDASDDMLAALFAAAEPNVAILALMGADSRLVQRVLDQTPSALARHWRAKLDQPGPTRLSDVEEAQRQIAHLAAQLAHRGRLDSPRPVFA